MSDENLAGHVVFPTLYFIGIGGIQSGIKFYGPFEGPGDAQLWGNEHIRDGRTWKIHDMSLVNKPELIFFDGQ